MEQKKKKTFLIIEIVVLSLFLLLFAGCIISELAAPESAVAIWMKTNIWDVNKTVISIKSHVPVLINSLIYIVLVYAICKIIRIIFSVKMKETVAILTGFDQHVITVTDTIVSSKVL